MDLSNLSDDDPSFIEGTFRTNNMYTHLCNLCREIMCAGAACTM